MNIRQSLNPAWLAISIAITTAITIALAPAVHAQTTEASGVKFDNTVQLANTRLLLNGAGTRYKAIFKVYAAGLYLNAKAATAEAALGNTGPRRVHIVMLRDIDANELGKLFTRGMEQNSPREEFSKSIAGTLKMSDIFSQKKKLAAGESFSIDWLPGTGTLILINGKPAAEPIAEPEFYTALLRIWLGNSPADAQLKQALLGRVAVPNAN